MTRPFNATRLFTTFVTGCMVALMASTAQAVMVGATTYVNQLAGATITSFGRVGMPGVVFNDNGAMALGVDGGLGTYGQSNANKYTSYANDGPTFFRWTLPAGSFSARTFMTQQGASYSGFTAASPYQLSINGVDVPGHNSPGLPVSSQFVITSDSKATVGNSAQILFNSLTETSGLGFAVMQEVVAIEDQLTRLPIASGSASSILGGYPVSQAFDNQAHLGWAATVGTPGETLTVNLATPGDVGAIWITGVDARSEIFNVSFNGAVTPTITGVEWVGTVNAALIKLDTVVTNVSSITLTFTNTTLLGATPAVHYIGEIIPFTIVYPVPEPSTGLLLGLGALGLVARCRRSRRTLWSWSSGFSLLAPPTRAG